MLTFQAHGDIVTVTTDVAVSSGDLVWFAALSLIGVAQMDAAANESVSLKRTGIFELTKDTALACAAGQPAYADVSGLDAATPTAPTVSVEEVGPCVGFFAEAAAAGTALVNVCLVPGVPQRQWGVVYYDFDEDGGAIGTIVKGPTLPDNTVITRTQFLGITTCTSATDAGTMAVGIDTDDAAGLLAALDIADVSNWLDAGVITDGIQSGDAADYSERVNNAAGRQFIFTIAVEAFTAGKFAVLYEYTNLG